MKIMANKTSSILSSKFTCSGDAGKRPYENKGFLGSGFYAKSISSFYIFLGIGSALRIFSLLSLVNFKNAKEAVLAEKILEKGHC